MKKKWKKIDDEGVLNLLKIKKYLVDLDIGLVYNNKNINLKPFYGKSSPKHQFVCLFNNGDSRRGISVAKLVWMAGTMSIVPKNFEVHHWDTDPSNNAFYNLFCLHKIDHLKIHHEYENEDDIPF